MKRGHILLSISIVVLVLVFAVGLIQAGDLRQPRRAPQASIGTGFTYQGQLMKDGMPINDTCNVAFRLYDASSSGAQIGSAITATLPISNGLLTTDLDFGADAFTGEARWLELAVQCPGDAGFTVFSERQELTPAPYALYAGNANLLDGQDADDFAPVAHTHTSPDKLKYFEEALAIPTHGASDWEAFTIDDNDYLVVANYRNDMSLNMDSKIYWWTGSTFSETQAIPTTGAIDWEFFTIGSDAYLAVANHHDGSTYNVESKIYHWDGVRFVEFQSMATNGAHDWEFFTIGGNAYLVVANYSNGATGNLNSQIYQWTGSSFAPFQTLATNGARDWEAFTMDGEMYLAVANQNNGSTFNINSTIYRWNGSSFVACQAIATNGAADWTSFTFGGAVYLAVANEWDGVTHNLTSRLYRWDSVSATFVEFQTFATHGARDVEFFTIGVEAYLTFSNNHDDSTFNLNSPLYRWNGANFVEYQTILTHGAMACRFFTLGSDYYLVVANYANDSTYNLDSVIYRAELDSWRQSGTNVYYTFGNVGIGTTTPGTRLDVARGAIRTDDQFISTVGMGTAPLSVTSSTRVENLNADLLDGQHASNFAVSSHAHGQPGFIISPLDGVGGQDIGQHNSAAIGVDGLPLISYYDATNDALKVAHCNDTACATATLTTLDNVGPDELDSSITIGADGLGLVSYRDSGTNRDLKVAHCSNIACTAATITTLDSNGDVGYFSSVTIGADGLGLISYLNYAVGACSLKVAHCSNTACTTATITTLESGGYTGYYSSITIGADGLGLISYYVGGSAADLKVAHCSDIACTAATITTLDSSGNVGDYTSITVGSDGLGLISYRDITQYDLKVAHCSDITCTTAIYTTLDSAGSVGDATSVSIGADGMGVIGYYDLTHGDVKVAHCSNLTCTVATLATVDGGDDVGECLALTIGVDGLPFISYYDDTNDDLKAAHCSNVFCIPYFRRR